MNLIYQKAAEVVIIGTGGRQCKMWRLHRRPGRCIMRASIRKQFAGIFIGLMTGTILLCWVINTLFLEEYYISNKTSAMYDAYSRISEAISTVFETEEVEGYLREICGKNNITIFIKDYNANVEYMSSYGGEELERRLRLYSMGMFPSKSDKIDVQSDYILQKIWDVNGEYLEMFGGLNSGVSFIMQTPLESIRESAKIANRFLAYVGSICAVTGGIVIWLVSRKITNPILELNKISGRMIHLDFDAKYHGKSRNEIDLLGDNINRLSSSLESTISELKTANNELQKDIEKKEQIDEMRKEFLSNVSHELKTPIALIQGYAEGLQEEINDDSESREFYCEVIIDEANKMNSMVKKLLTLNQLEFGNDMVTLERFDVVSLIRNYIQSAQILTKQNEIEVRMGDYEPVYVWADEFKTEEVFMNYFTNAVNHCKGKKIIDVKLEQSGNKVRVSVFNTGDPIPEESIEFLWEKFYKVDKARTREYGGNGVGLSIVKAIMESMNQQYGVMNFTNGVIFWFELETVQSDGDGKLY